MPISKAHLPKTSRTDIFLSIKPEHMANVATGCKNHEYRRYLLPPTTRHVWFYTTAPISALTHIARVSRPRCPGEVPENGGLGNADFNAGKKVSRYGYEILDLWALSSPIVLRKAIEKGYLKGAPQKYCFVPRCLLQHRPLEEQLSILKNGESVAGREGQEAVD